MVLVYEFHALIFDEMNIGIGISIRWSELIQKFFCWQAIDRDEIYEIKRAARPANEVDTYVRSLSELLTITWIVISDTDHPTVKFSIKNFSAMT